MATDLRAREEQIAASRATLLQTNYVDTRQIRELVPIAEILSLDDMQKMWVVPLTHTAHQLVLGYCEQTKRSNIDLVKQKLRGFNIEFSFISMSGFKELLNRYIMAINPPKPVDPNILTRQIAKEVLDVKARSENPELFSSKLLETDQKELFRVIAQQAYALGASDIHIEPSEEDIRLRFRVDGVLHTVANLKHDRFELLLSTLQMKSGIKWNANYAQTGSLSEQLFDTSGKIKTVNMRVETIPTSFGSDIVVRIFNVDVKFLELGNLGLSENKRKPIYEFITHPHGMVLMVGPTGSGKTSTLYAIINQLNKGDVKIVTLEDPIEYRLSGITQIPVDSEHKESFNDKLKAVLREDPDIIMIGEIRDADTAKTALQASLTGHLVLSTFHANSAAAAVSRLMDMIGQNPLLASAVRLIMAQRLLRRLCEHCKSEYVPNADIRQKIAEILQNLPLKADLSNLKLYKAVGCAQCYHIGYKDRTMAAEQLIMSKTMQNLIAKGTAETTEQVIHDAAVAEGMITLLQDALLKALDGITSIEEVFRVIEA